MPRSNKFPKPNADRDPSRKPWKIPAPTRILCVPTFCVAERWCKWREARPKNIELAVVRQQLEEKHDFSVTVSFIGKFRTGRVRSNSPGVEMYLTPATLYALRLSFQQGSVSSAFRKNMVERNIKASAFILATVGLSMSIFSVRKMLTSKHQVHL